MNCRETAARLYDYLDAELTPEVEAQVRAHLVQCRNCFEHFSFEEAFLRFLRARREARGAPEALRRRILDRLLLEHEGLDAEPE